LNQGLRNEGLSLESLLDAHATFIEISFYFGPNLNKNGYKHEKYVKPSVIAQIKKLWHKMYN